MKKKNLHYNNKIHKDLPALEQNHFWFKARNKIILYILKKFCKKKAIYLEIGCGTGYVLKMIIEKFSNFKITGSELFDSGLKQAKKRLKNYKKIKLIKLDARNLRVKNKYDIIGAFDVIEHIKEEDIILNKINKALKKDGCFIFTVPQHKFLWSINDEIGFHQRRYTRKYLIKN
jgi:SAM-dependent methyltransferase